MSTYNLPLLENPHGIERELGILILNKASEKIALPLSSVDISAKVINQVAQVTVKQVFRNDCQDHLEAVYIFPLAAGSAVYSFNMKVGERIIEGVVQERQEARRQYQQALEDGRRTALMEQERDDVFTVQVGNLPPQEQVTVEICYSERLPFFENGGTELRLPLVVSPRYIPGTPLQRDNVGDGVEADTDQVPDASRITPPRLAKGTDPQTDLKLKVAILPEDGIELSDLSCTQHATKAALCQGGIAISLARADERLNRDFVLRWRSAAGKLKSSLLTYTAEDGQSYGMLSMLPPRRNGYLGAPRDVVFVLDRSGSMNGIKMTSAVRSCAILLNTLGPQDRFAIAAFDNVVEWMPFQNGDPFKQADTAGIEAGEKHLRTINSRGGTEMDPALKAALDALAKRASKDGRLPALVVLTDGEVGNESQILQRIQKEIGDARLFVVGIDTSVNSGLLKKLANLGGGTATFVAPGVQLEEALASIGREIGTPVVMDIQVENMDLSIDRASLSPSRIPDIFAGRASICFFKLKGKGKICIKGKFADGKRFEERVRAQKVDVGSIAQLWAKTHISDLEDQYRIADSRAKVHIKNEIVQIAVAHSLLSKFTAFVAVDKAEVVNKSGEIRKVVQPVDMPASWEMDNEPMLKRLAKSCMADDELLATSTRSKSLCKQDTGTLAQSIQSQVAKKNSPSGGTPNSISDVSYGSAPNIANDGWGSPKPNIANDGWGSSSANVADDSWKNSSSGGSNSSQNEWGASQANSWNAADTWEEDAEQVQTGMWKSFSLEESIPPVAAPLPNQIASKLPEEPASPIAPAAPAPQADTAKEEAIPQEVISKKEMLAAQDKQDQQHDLLSSARSLFEKLKKYVCSRGSKKHQLDVMKVGSPMAEFFQDFEKAFEEIAKAELPDAEKLEAARLKLLQTIAPLNIGMELPCLQRFLRATAIELISATKDKSVTIADLQRFWISKQDLFDETKQETLDLLMGTEAAFWESSI